MRVYVLTDAEGVAGVDQWDSHDQSTPAQVRAKREMVELLVGEVNAAVEGALAAGADEVFVNDGHGYGRNIPPEALHHRAHLVRGSVRPRPLVGLDGETHAFLFVGQHAMEGAPRGMLAHTWSHRRARRCFLDDREIGEIGIAVHIAASFGVPTVFLSGDRAAVDEARTLVPEMETISVKEGIDLECGVHMQPTAARDAIRTGVERALGRRDQIPVRPVRGPHVFRQEFVSAPMGGVAFLALAALGPLGSELLRRKLGRPKHDSVSCRIAGPRTLEHRGEGLLEVIGAALG